MIELEHQTSGPRFFVGGTALHCGDEVQLELDNGLWVPFRFEWSHNLDEQVHLYFSRRGHLRIEVEDFVGLVARLPEVKPWSALG